MSEYSIVVGGGISEIWDVVSRKSPGAAINAWFKGIRKRPLDTGIDSEDDDWEPDLVAYREFWFWIWNNNEAVLTAEARASARPDYPYVYGYVANKAIDKASKLRSLSDAELLKEYEWSGYGPFTRG